MAKLFPSLSFTNAKQALAYYEEVFDATSIVRMPVGKEQAKEFDIPLEELENTTIHGIFPVLGANIFCSDNFMDVTFSTLF